MKHLFPLRSDGFTLLEVLVALLILAVSMTALVEGAGKTAGNYAYMRDKSFTHWVGMNVIADLAIENRWPDIGRIHGDEEMAGIRWYWQADISNTFDVNVRRVDVRVIAVGNDAVSTHTTLVAYLPRSGVEGALR